MKITTFTCNLCQTKLNLNSYSISDRSFGFVYEKYKGWIEKSPKEAEIHLCVRCLSSIQTTRKVCGQGFRDCPGGVLCSSDHK